MHQKLTNTAISGWPEWLYLETVSQLLEKVIDASKEADRHQVGALFPFLDSVRESTSSLKVLAEMNALRDSYVISRVIYETSINACFLITSPVVLTNRASIHAKQKTLRNLVRRIEIAGKTFFDFKFDKAEEIQNQPKHKEWIEEFTSKSGREITSWTPESVQKRLESIYEKFGGEATKGLVFGLLLYQHASEIAHGTLYGTLFSWGAMEPGRILSCPEDLGCFRKAELRHVLKLVCFTLESLIQVCVQVLALPLLAEQAKQARLRYYECKEKNILH